MHPDLTLTLQPQTPQAACHLNVRGELDFSNADRLTRTLDGITLDPQAVLIIDLTGLEYCDSTGITALIGAHQRAAAAGSALAFAGVSPDIAHIFAILGLDRLFACYDTPALAEEQLRPNR